MSEINIVRPLVELQNNEVSQIYESAGENSTKKNLYIQGVFLQADVKNRNGRIYESSWFTPYINEYVNKYVKTGLYPSLGELDHPTDRSKIDISKASHRIVELVRDGSNWVGKALILDTPMGNVVRGLLEGGCKLGVSSRALGSTYKKNGIEYVDGSKFKLETAADIVSDPSAPEAFIDALYEGKEWVWVSESELIPLTEYKQQIDKNINNINKSKEEQQRFFNTILNLMRK